MSVSGRYIPIPSTAREKDIARLAQRDLLTAIKKADEALDSLWASVGDRLLARGPLSDDYAHSTMRKVQGARAAIAAAIEASRGYA